MDIERPPKTDDSTLDQWLLRLWEVISLEDIRASKTWDPGSISHGNKGTTDVTVTGAEMGDYVEVSHSLDVQDLQLTADVTAANTVTCILSNSTGGAVNLAEGTVYVRVRKRTA